MGLQDLHCNINEKNFSLVLFLNRFITGLVILYVTLGCLFFYREFLYNLTALRVPLSVPMGFALVVAELFAALFLILGWFTRWAAFLSVVCTLASAFVFFAGEFNKIFVALSLLLLAPLITILMMGPGRMSLDFAHARRRTKNNFRG